MSSAERVAAHRKRQKELDQLEQFEHRSQGVSLEQYIAGELAITQAGIDEGSIATQDALGNPLDPLANTERYARWRWQGVLDGSVASL
jgi:hypothetical protein